MTGKCVLYYIGLFVRPCSLNHTFFTEYISHLTSNPGFSTRQTCFLFTEIITNAFYWRLRNQMTVFLLSFFFLCCLSVLLFLCFLFVFSQMYFLMNEGLIYMKVYHVFVFDFHLSSNSEGSLLRLSVETYL